MKRAFSVPLRGSVAIAMGTGSSAAHSQSEPIDIELDPVVATDTPKAAQSPVEAPGESLVGEQAAVGADQAATNLVEATVAADKAVMKDLAKRRRRLEQLAEGVLKEMIAELDWVAKTDRVGMLARERERGRRDLARAEPRGRSLSRARMREEDT